MVPTLMQILATSPIGTFTADLDQDGRADLVTYGSVHVAFSVYRNTGAGFADREDHVSGDVSMLVVPIDLEGDGFPDLCGAIDSDLVCFPNVAGTLGAGTTVVSSPDP